MKPPVIIADYDPAWPAMYEAERARILGAIGESLVAIEHVGSTAVPGLGAKPIIDIMAAVRHLDDARACIAPLESIGYQYVPDYEDQLPERRYFRKGTSAHPRTHHLHMVELTSGFWARLLLFRDHLRAHPEAVQAYDHLKRELASRHGRDVEGYTEAKTEFVTSIEAAARAAQGEPSHEMFLRRAIDQARLARAEGNEPFGAALVLDDVVVYEAPNKIFTLSDPTAHAETTAVRDYCRAFGRLSLAGYTLYASTEPCAMCAGAIHWARLSRVVYSVSQAMLQRLSGGKPKPGCAGIINAGHKQIQVIGPLLTEEGLTVFEGYTFGSKAQ